MVICTKEYYDKKGSLPSKRILLKLTDDEYEKLTSYSDPAYEEYNQEFRNYLKARNLKIVYGFINKALGSGS